MHHEHLVRAREWLLGLPRPIKQRLIYALDATIHLIALWGAFVVRLGGVFPVETLAEFAVFLCAPLLGWAGLHVAGTYRLLVRRTSRIGMQKAVLGVTAGVLAFTMLVLLTGTEFAGTRALPRSVVLIYWFLATAMVLSSREIISWFLSGATGTTRSDQDGVAEERAVVIWGYSTQALEFASYLNRSNGRYHLIGIVDADPALRFQKAGSVKIYPPSHIGTLVPRDGIKEIFINAEVVDKKQATEIVNSLSPTSIAFKVIPSPLDVISGKVAISDVKPIKVEDLLGRDPVAPNMDLLTSMVHDKVVMVTGAGGSIGSEIARQVVRLKPKKVILVDISEAALHTTFSEITDFVELKARNGGPALSEIVAIIGSVADSDTMRAEIAAHGVQIIYHAAAYKHVPLVESNPFIGLSNNAFGTRALARVAMQQGVQHFVLISTDKAVRPTNVMGASKRLAEMILHELTREPDCRTIFCMVRFGNVLDSSGSVVPRFRKQIAAGRSVTVTHPDINRYFMLIAEAVELVIHAGAMARNGDVFVLDMGVPVRIADLARTMIHLSGKTVADESNPSGDIAIVYTGLRPGEKLFEELLIDGDTVATAHPHIFRLNEPPSQIEGFDEQLAALEACVEARDEAAVRAHLGRLVDGYKIFDGNPSATRQEAL